jgi:hypothetical protein
VSGGIPAGGLQPHPAAADPQVQHAQAGLWWPAADPGNLREAAAIWRSLAAELESVSGAASAVIGGVAAQNQGQSIDALEAYWGRRWAGGSGALPAVAEGARALADGLERYAGAVEQARARIQELIAAAATAVIIGVALTVLTVGISDVAAGLVAGSLVAAAAAVGIELSTEVAAIIATGLVFTGMGALEGGLSDMAIQGERVGYFHDQTSINWNEVLQYTAVGAATAGVTFGAGTAIEAGAPAVGRIGARLTGTERHITAGEEAAAGGHSIRDVNPGFPTQGRVMNCANCAVATDATLAGRPAVALPGVPTPVSVQEKYFGGAFQPMRSAADIERALQAAGPGARGIVFGQRAGGIGHVFNGVNQGGVVRFLDGQVGGEASFRGLSTVWWLWTSRP